MMRGMVRTFMVAVLLLALPGVVVAQGGTARVVEGPDAPQRFLWMVPGYFAGSVTH